LPAKAGFGKSPRAAVTRGKLLKVQLRELHFNDRKHLSEKPAIRQLLFVQLLKNELTLPEKT
jgi:hypothetical protein